MEVKSSLTGQIFGMLMCITGSATLDWPPKDNKNALQVMKLAVWFQYSKASCYAQQVQATRWFIAKKGFWKKKNDSYPETSLLFPEKPQIPATVFHVKCVGWWKNQDEARGALLLNLDRDTGLSHADSSWVQHLSSPQAWMAALVLHSSRHFSSDT